MRSQSAILLATFLYGTILCNCDLHVAADMTMRVEIDVYSGRPNPVFVLTAEASRKLAGMLLDLPKAGRNAPDPGLGYRGFLVTDPDGSFGLPPGLRIFGGWVVAGAGAETYTDINNAESWLMEQARQAGHAALLP